MLRNPPDLAPDDSLHRFVQVMRFEPMGMLPVTSRGELLGILGQADIVTVLSIADRDRRDLEMERPVSAFMRAPVAVLRAGMTLEEAGRVFADSGQTMLPVLDDRDYYLGAVAAADLLVPDLPVPRPARIGGMATPFGVYLTDGTVQAGVGNLALMSSGVMMMGILLVAVGVLNAAFWALSQAVGHPVPLLIPLGDDIVIRNGWLGLASVGESLLLFAVFMLLMRLTRLAGYHAAEHQTVHAIERCEPLVPAIVARMPRAHPRCGTNLLAAVLLFTQARQAMGYVPALDGMAEPLAALAALFLWRPVGTFLQERFTTKPADAREIGSGIAAGSTLLARYLEEAPTRPTLFRRVWCSGMIQILTGFAASLALISVVQFLAEPVRHLLMRQ